MPHFTVILPNVVCRAGMAKLMSIKSGTPMNQTVKKAEANAMPATTDSVLNSPW